MCLEIWVLIQRRATDKKEGGSFFSIDSELPQLQIKIVLKVSGNLSGMAMNIFHCFFPTHDRKQRESSTLLVTEYDVDGPQLLNYVQIDDNAQLSLMTMLSYQIFLMNIDF